MRYLLDYLPKFGDWFARRELPETLADQVKYDLFRRRVVAFEQMTDLPGDVQELLGRSFRIFSTNVEQRVEQPKADPDHAQSIGMHLADEQWISCKFDWAVNDRADSDENSTARKAVLSICTQTGFPDGSRDFESAYTVAADTSLVRNLSTGELIEQVLRLQQRLPTADMVGAIELTGQGEPLANLDNVLQALDLIISSNGLKLKNEQVLIRTVGLPAAIRRLAKLDLSCQLVISLHAANDPLRHKLIAGSQQTSLESLLTAVDFFYKTTGRKLDLEYILLGGINDRSADADQLADLLTGRPVNVILTPYPADNDFFWQPPSPQAEQQFCRALQKADVSFSSPRLTPNQLAKQMVCITQPSEDFQVESVVRRQESI